MGTKKASAGESLFWTALCIIGAAAVLAIVGGVWRPDPMRHRAALGRSDGADRIITPAWHPEAGMVGKLGYPGGGGQVVFLCRSELFWTKMIDAQNDAARGGPGADFQLAEMITTGAVKEYPVGTRVRVVKVGFTSTKVVILDGENGRDIGWIQAEEVLPP